MYQPIWTNNDFTRFYQIASDCTILFRRAFLGKKVVAFGEDGFGQYGSNHMPKTFEITDVTVYSDRMDESSVPGANGYVQLTYLPDGRHFVQLTLDGYDARDCGHVATDKNLEISLRKLMIDAAIDPNCLTWAGMSPYAHSQHQTSLKINHNLLHLGY